MRVFVLIGSLNQGGAEFQSLEIARLFRDQGHNVTILALTDYHYYHEYVIQHKLVYNALSNSIPRFIRILQAWIYVLKYKPDVLISYTRVVSRVALMIRRFSFQKFVLLISERTSKTDTIKDPRYFKLAEGSDILTTNSISKFYYIKNIYPRLSGKLHFMPNLLQTDSILHKPLINDGDFNYRFLYAGRLSAEKNVVGMIEAFATLDRNVSWSLDIYGATHHVAYYAQVQKTIKNCDLEHKITLKGVQDLRDVYSKYDFLCLFSEYEGFSNVISEAMAAGLPVLCSGITENVYLVSDGENGLVSNGTDSESISLILKKALNLSIVERNTISANNLKKATDLFNRKVMYTMYMKLITQSCGA